MKATTYLENNLYFDLHSERENTPDHLRFFDNLRALDAVQFRTPLDDFYSSLPSYCVADTNAPVSAATDPMLSMGWQIGELDVPETASHDVYNSNNNLYMYSDFAQYIDPYAYTPTAVQQNCAITPDIYRDSANAGYLSLPYSTAQALNVDVHSSACDQLHIYHANTGMSNCNIPYTNVMQPGQEPETLRASDYYAQYTPVQQDHECHQYTHDSQAFSYDTPYTPDPQASQYDTPYTLNSSLVNGSEYNDLLYTQLAQENTPPALYESDDSPSALATSLPSWPEMIPTSSPASTPFYISPSNFVMPNYAQPDSLSSSALSTPFSASLPELTHEPSPALPPSPVALTPPASTRPKPLQKKRVSKSKKVTSAPAADPKRRAGKWHTSIPVRSENMLMENFALGTCTLCTRGPKKFRVDRALEHIASNHIWQTVKKMEEFDADLLKRMEPASLVKTSSQFEFVRQWVEKMRCSICVRETGMVMRKGYLKQHLKTVHRKLPESTRRAELKRVNDLVTRKEGFHNFHDEFLYHFSNVK